MLGINKVIVSNNKNPLKLLVVAIDHYSGMVAVSDLLASPYTRPKKLLFQTITDNCKAKIWRIEEHSFDEILYKRDEDIPLLWRELRDKNYAVITDLVEDSYRLHNYLFGDATGILNSLVKTSGRTKKVVQAYINTFFARGQFENSLLPTYYECGAHYRGPETPVILSNGDVCLKSKPGRHTSYGETFRYRTQEDNRKIEAFAKTIKPQDSYVLKELYREYIKSTCLFKLKPKNVPECEMAADFYAVLPPNHRISERTFKIYLQKITGPLKWLKMRKGSINFARDNEGKPGLALKGLRGPGSRFEIDSTIADCYIRYEFSDELLSIGRPVIYLVIDVMTTMITGLHVCFHGPDWHGASQALFNAFTDKREFCERFGVTYREGDWPCSIVCNELTLDRGTENSHKNVRAILRGEIGISGVNYNAYHRGDAKGTVEKKFDILQSNTIPEGNGKVQKIPKKEEQHASRTPVYTYNQFMKRLIKHIIQINNKSKRIDSHNFEMEKAGVACRPRDVWNWGMNNSIIPPNRVSQDKLRFALLPEEKAVVQDKGIYFRGLFYSSNEVVAKQWLTKAKNQGRWPIDVRYSDINTTFIWCKDPNDNSGKVIQLETTDRSRKYANQLWVQVEERLEVLKDSLAREREDEFVSQILIDLELDQMDAHIRSQNTKLKASTAKGMQPNMKSIKDETAMVQKNRDYAETINQLNEQQSIAKPEKTKTKSSALADATRNIF